MLNSKLFIVLISSLLFSQSECKSLPEILPEKYEENGFLKVLRPETFEPTYFQEPEIIEVSIYYKCELELTASGLQNICNPILNSNADMNPKIIRHVKTPQITKKINIPTNIQNTENNFREYSNPKDLQITEDLPERTDFQTAVNKFENNNIKKLKKNFDLPKTENNNAEENFETYFRMAANKPKNNNIQKLKKNFQSPDNNAENNAETYFDIPANKQQNKDIQKLKKNFQSPDNNAENYPETDFDIAANKQQNKDIQKLKKNFQSPDSKAEINPETYFEMAANNHGSNKNNNNNVQNTMDQLILKSKELSNSRNMVKYPKVKTLKVTQEEETTQSVLDSMLLISRNCIGDFGHDGECKQDFEQY